MKLAEYVEREGWGSIQRICERSGVSYPTVHGAAKHWTPITKYDVAKAISEATGGEVSIKELCEPGPPPAAEASEVA